MTTSSIAKLTLAAFVVFGSGGCEHGGGSARGQNEQALEVDVEAEPEVEPGSLSAEPAVVGARVFPDPDDLDADGFGAEVDPDDEDANVRPGTPEPECAAIDLGVSDVSSCRPRLDADGDGVEAEVDCDDLDARIRPLAFDVRCDQIDQNCDGRDDCDRDGDGVLDHADPAPDDPLLDGRRREEEEEQRLERQL